MSATRRWLVLCVVLMGTFMTVLDVAIVNAGGLTHTSVSLRDALLALPSRVMVVIKATPAIRALYADDRWWVREAAKTYPWTIKSRNDRRVISSIDSCSDCFGSMMPGVSRMTIWLRSSW